MARKAIWTQRKRKVTLEVVGGLECEECGCQSDEQARGWRAFIAGDSDDAGDEEEEALVFCPACSAREFG